MTPVFNFGDGEAEYIGKAILWILLLPVKLVKALCKLVHKGDK